MALRGHQLLRRAALYVALGGASAAVAFATGTSRAAQPANEIRTVTIGAQQWMAEDLQVSTYRNGDPIPEAKSAEDWLAAYRTEKGVWCYYNNDPSTGRLYNWYAVHDPRGLAPKGWHVPTDTEFGQLVESVGGASQAFEKLSAAGGFGGRPSGARYYKDATFNHRGTIGFWWSASNPDRWNASYFAMHFGLKQVARSSGGMNTGHSIRCIKDRS